MRKVAIFGAAGPVGRAVAAELEARGVPFRAVGRSRGRLEQAFGGMAAAEIAAADIAEPRRAEDAARGADTIIYAVGAPYTGFRLHPKLMATTVDAAQVVGVERLVVVSSVYSYGVPQTRKVAETHPRQPEGFKGRMRKEQEDIALDAQKKGRFQALVIRLPDFYGPWADNSLANPIIRAALDGKTANWLGSLQAPHEFVFVPDAAKVIAELAGRPECYGEAWNFGGPAETTGGEFIQKAYRAAGRSPKYRTIGRTMLKIAGWFKPMARELLEMMYLVETPVILDDTKLARVLGTLPEDSLRRRHPPHDGLDAGGIGAGRPAPRIIEP